MGLKDELSGIGGNRRRFVLFRIADVDTGVALSLCRTTRGTYNTWLQDSKFVEIYRKVKDLTSEYRQEAIQLLRRDNQLAAVLLEGKVITKMKEELESGEYHLIRTNLAREVYSKLMGTLDAVPQTQVLSWAQRISQIITHQEQLPEGEVIDAEFTAVTEQEAESPKSLTESEDQQSPASAQEEAEDEEAVEE